MNRNTEDEIQTMINDAEEVGDAATTQAPANKPRLLIENADPDRTVAA